MLECVINVSEGRRVDVVAEIGAAGGDHLLDVHIDGDHHRSVFTLAGPEVFERAFALVEAAVRRLDLRTHDGVHPRLGVADVVPFVPLTGSTLDDAIAARDRMAERVADRLGVPCLRYGPERTLPDVRRHGAGEVRGHPTAGICCVGARPVLVAYNLWLAPPASVADAKRIAAYIRTPALRTLGLGVGGSAQVSCNLVDPERVGPAEAFDAVVAHAPIERAELVGLVPRSVLERIAPERWAELDLASTTTTEARLEQAGLDGGSFGTA